MTADTALRLERWLGVSAAFWMNLQKRYELDIARERSDDVLKAIEPLHRASPTLKMQQLFLIMFIASYSCNVLHVVAKE